ncbi:MAG: YdjY domain-containing protein [Fimbriiglobus sp.]
MSRALFAAVLAALLAAPAVAQSPADPANAGKEGEPLPDPPKSDPKSEFVPLNKEKTLILEKLPAGGRRILVASEVCLREGQLEVFLCRKNTKEHEAVVRTEVDARFIHAALVAAGAKPGKPVQYVNPDTGDADYKPATGAKIKVSVHYRRGGQLHTHAAQEWIKSLATKKPMAHEWVFAGSRFVKHPDRPDDPDYYCANNGEVIGISNFPDSMLDLPVEVSRDNDGLAFEAMTEQIPPLRSKVWVILEPAEKK